MRKALRVLLWILGGLVALIVVVISVSLVFYPAQYVYRVLAWQQSDVSDYLHHFPHRAINPSPNPFHFVEASDRQGIDGILAEVFDTGDVEAFLEKMDTQSFIVIQDDKVLYEGYFNGTDRDTLATSFSVAKSFTSTLVGIALSEGSIHSVDDPITDYLPELLERDPRFGNITIRHVLLMASGLDYQSDRTWILNGDDPLTTYYPDQRKAALEFTHVIDPPGQYFQYNKYHPQLLGLILERATGRSVTDYLQEKLWDRIGMEFGGSWCLDSASSGFEKMETGINARPIDFAKLGRLYLRDGDWDGTQVVPSDWVAQSTQMDPSTRNATYYSQYSDFYDSGGYYKFMWWGLSRGQNKYDFCAEGDRGQLIYVSPDKELIIVRNGFAYGDLDWLDWLHAAYSIADEIPPP